MPKVMQASPDPTDSEGHSGDLVRSAATWYDEDDDEDDENDV
jgi:hypothetical protein